MSSSSGSVSGEDVDSEIGLSTELGSTLRTREEELTLGGTSGNYDGDTSQQREDGFTFSSLGIDTGQEEEDQDVAIALPPTESDGAGEYHEVALTGSAALDVLDQVNSNYWVG